MIELEIFDEFPSGAQPQPLSAWRRKQTGTLGGIPTTHFIVICPQDALLLYFFMPFRPLDIDGDDMCALQLREPSGAETGHWYSFLSPYTNLPR
jgi:hypothetical protein